MDYNRLLKNQEEKICKSCNILMEKGVFGNFTCPNCGAVELDDFHIIKECLRENGPMNAQKLSELTGIPRKDILAYLDAGSIEIVHKNK